MTGSYSPFSLVHRTSVWPFDHPIPLGYVGWLAGISHILLALLRWNDLLNIPQRKWLVANRASPGLAGPVAPNDPSLVRDL